MFKHAVSLKNNSRHCFYTRKDNNRYIERKLSEMMTNYRSIGRKSASWTKVMFIF